MSTMIAGAGAGHMPTVSYKGGWEVSAAFSARGRGGGT